MNSKKDSFPISSNYSLEEFKKIPEKKGLLPLVVSLSFDTETPVSLYKKVAEGKAYSFLFESAEKDESNGRYSIVGFDPIEKISFDDGKAIIEKKKGDKLKKEQEIQISIPGNKNNAKSSSALEILAERIKEYDSVYAKEFFGGLVGFFSFESMKYFEDIPFLPRQKGEALDALFVVPRIIIRFDHFSSEISLAFFADLSKGRSEEFFTFQEEVKKVIEKIKKPLKAEILDIPKGNEIFYKENKFFEEQARKAKEKIIAGEIFQVQISQRFTRSSKENPFEIYRRLRLRNPSPYMFFLDMKGCHIIGSSPETLVRLKNKKILLRPIAGTRKRGKDEAEDQKLEKELINNPKERAEHAMLVDLARNDIGRVAKTGSVKVSREFYVRKFSHVQHILSDVEGELKKDKNMFDVFRTSFPAGTLTGAPKIRATEIITQLENIRRGIYGGGVGYFAFGGDMDFAILIRSIFLANKEAHVQAAGGIVYDSTPKAESKECAKKASACLSIL